MMAESQEEYLCKVIDNIQRSFPHVDLLKRTRAALSALGDSKIMEINEKARGTGTNYPAAWACLKVVLAANNPSTTPRASEEYRKRQLKRLELQLAGKNAQLEGIKDDPWDLELWKISPVVPEIEDEIANLEEQLRQLNYKGPKRSSCRTSQACRAAQMQFKWLKDIASKGGQTLRLSLSHEHAVKAGPIELIILAALDFDQSDTHVLDEVRTKLIALKKSSDRAR